MSDYIRMVKAFERNEWRVGTRWTFGKVNFTVWNGTLSHKVRKCPYKICKLVEFLRFVEFVCESLVSQESIIFENLGKLQAEQKRFLLR